MLEEGIFDIHCHIVPGVDDGAADIEETRKLLEMEYKQGVRNIILTPHFRFQMFETSLEKVQRQFRLAEEAAADISKDLHLYLGCEFHANMEMLPMLREKKVSTMAGSRYVLVEFSHNSEASYSRFCVIRSIAEPSSATFISSSQGYLVPKISLHCILPRRVPSFDQK